MVISPTLSWVQALSHVLFSGILSEVRAQGIPLAHTLELALVVNFCIRVLTTTVKQRLFGLLSLIFLKKLLLYRKKPLLFKKVFEGDSLVVSASRLHLAQGRWVRSWWGTVPHHTMSPALN